MAAKNIIADLNKSEKLNGDNYNIWHRKVQYILEEQEQHLQEMSNMMRELKIARHVLNDQQQVQVVVRSLPRGWEYMNAMLTHNDSIKTFADVQRHLELEEKRLMAMRIHPEVNMAQSSKRSGSSHKRKKGGKNVKQDDNAEPHAKRAKTNKRKRGRRAGKNRDKSKVTCYNCGKLGHFAHSIATDHVVRRREAYVEYRRIPAGTRWIYMGNETAVEVKGIGTLHIRYARRPNLVSS
ncbi:Zinc finger, CCHC-type [Corchorus olitorius]|uniref:Zinc finger, CCHC-type n=1 Tax=Corchorus olitorius TaxID=93759 RepID=A0A1R3JZG8_9ROSI|nr:Zinc finger, CCHC-type [Corchorus olitorius]